MREVDQALARAFAQRGKSAPATVPPAPHLRVPRANSLDHNPRASSTPLEWPPVVLSLERLHGDRFANAADILIQARDKDGRKVILFTSCHRAEGRTTLVLTLARSLALRTGRTLLVDADLTGPMIARQFGLRPEIGLEDVVESGRALADALIEVPGQRLWLLPLRNPVVHPRAFLASPAWTCMLARLRREYDLVLIDGGPMFAGLSAALLHRSVDAAVLVYNRSLTAERGLTRAREVLDAGGIPVIGIAETFAV